jgi:hypothetical protein
MSDQPSDESSIATAGAARTAELARGGTDPVAERRHVFDRERKRRASVKAPLAIASFERAVTTLAGAAP